jgi:hypothetical protein
MTTEPERESLFKWGQHTLGPVDDSGVEHDGSDASRLAHVEDVLGIDRDQRGTSSTIIDVIREDEHAMVWEHLEDLNERLKAVEERLGIALATPEEESS